MCTFFHIWLCSSLFLKTSTISCSLLQLPLCLLEEVSACTVFEGKGMNGKAVAFFYAPKDGCLWASWFWVKHHWTLSQWLGLNEGCESALKGQLGHQFPSDYVLKLGLLKNTLLSYRDVSSVELLMNNHQGIKAEIDARNDSFTTCIELGKSLLARKHYASEEVGWTQLVLGQKMILFCIVSVLVSQNLQELVPGPLGK